MQLLTGVTQLQPARLVIFLNLSNIVYVSELNIGSLLIDDVLFLFSNQCKTGTCTDPGANTCDTASGVCKCGSNAACSGNEFWRCKDNTGANAVPEDNSNSPTCQVKFCMTLADE